MNINVYTHESGPLSRAFLQVFNLTNDKLVETSDQSTADVILITGMDDLRPLYNEHQLFLVLLTGVHGHVSPSQPVNVCLLDGLNLFGPNGVVKLIQQLESHREALVKRVPETVPVFSDIVRCDKVYRVLVIDDTPKNLRIAEKVLVGHEVATVAGLQEALKKIVDGVTFDAVLTDMEMLPDKQYPSLSLDHYGIRETVPLGFAVVLEMTGRNMPVAVVTDGNHHAGWVSAMFDHIHSANINGQKVLFFNGIGKRWDKALKCLMEP